MIHGATADDLDLVKARAKQVVIDVLVAKAEGDGVPATLRAMYAIKTAEARTLLAGGTSSFVEKEAELRGVPALALAGMIVGMAEQSEALELQRVALGLRIDAAEDPAAVVQALEQAGLKLPDDQV
jgi:hypothetical protein